MQFAHKAILVVPPNTLKDVRELFKAMHVHVTSMWTATRQANSVRFAVVLVLAASHAP